MGTTTIGLQDEAYQRLKARKRDGESFTDLVERLLDEATVDWREGYGTLDTAEMHELEQLVEMSRTRTGDGLANRQEEAIAEPVSLDEDVDGTV